MNDAYFPSFVSLKGCCVNKIIHMLSEKSYLNIKILLNGCMSYSYYYANIISDSVFVNTEVLRDLRCTIKIELKTT